MATEWRFDVTLESTQTVVTLTNPMNVSMNIKLNTPGSVTMTIAMGYDYDSFILPIQSTLTIYRRGRKVWGGVIMTADFEIGENQFGHVTFTAVGYFEFLNHRIIRTLPGYALATSAFNFTNPGAESALSGWSTSSATVTRDTSVFNTGAASYLLSANRTGPFGDYPGSTTQLVYGTNSTWGSSLVVGKRYRLKFNARVRRDTKYLNAAAPYTVQILEGSTVVGSASLTYSASAWVAYTIEWLSNSTTPTLKFLADTNPPQFSNSSFDTTSGLSFYPAGGGVANGAGQVDISGDSSGVASVQNSGWTTGKSLQSGKTYQVKQSYYTANTASSGSIIRLDYNNGQSATVSTVGHLGWAVETATMGAVASSDAQPTFLNYNNMVTASSLLEIDWNIVLEVSNNTDSLFNVDDIVLQEYAGDGIYKDMDAGQIASLLLSKTNVDKTTGIIVGTTETTALRTRTYQQYSNIGKEIQALADTESGFDWTVTPDKVFNVYNRTQAAYFPVTTDINTYSANRFNSLSFDYGTVNDNVASVRKTVDGSLLQNRVNVKGKYAVGFAESTQSQTDYALFESFTSLSDVIDATNSVLPAYANAELTFYKQPLSLYDITLKAGGNVPKLFIDFNVGDRVALRVLGYGSTGSIATNVSGGIPVRIFGAALSIDQDGNDRISSLQLSNS